MRETRTYDDDFKREAVLLVKTSGKRKTEICRDLGIAPSTLQGWLSTSVEDKSGNITTNSELTRLKRELADARLERDILKKAVAIFSKAQK